VNTNTETEVLGVFGLALSSLKGVLKTTRQSRTFGHNTYQDTPKQDFANTSFAASVLHKAQGAANTTRKN
jgi:hypothetical protein